MGHESAPELSWIFQPAPDRPDVVQALAGTPVHGVGVFGADGHTEVVLRDGTRLRISRAEIVAAQPP